MLIQKDPVATILVKNGHIEIQHHSDGTLKPCLYCKVLTKNRNFGMAECEECVEFEYSKCEQCQFGVQKQRFVTDGDDLNDHFVYWIACTKRDCFGNIRTEPDFENCLSAWHVTPPERKRCFTPKGGE